VPPLNRDGFTVEDLSICVLPERNVPKSRQQIIASRKTFLSEQNLLSDDMQEQFQHHKTSFEQVSQRKPRYLVPPLNRDGFTVEDLSICPFTVCIKSRISNFLLNEGGLLESSVMSNKGNMN
jgi:hypothetical protein